MARLITDDYELAKSRACVLENGTLAMLLETGAPADFDGLYQDLNTGELQVRFKL